MASRCRPTQAELNFPVRHTWGGRRKGAGRPPGPGRRNTPHRARPLHRAAHPVLVTLRARPEVASLRALRVFERITRAIAAAQNESFRIVEFSVQGDHIHLIVEANGKRELSSGMRGLSIRIARSVNRCLNRKGRFWGDRYHARALGSPREVRNAILYVVMNHRHHGHADPIDPRSSAPWFDGFRAATGGPTPPDSPVRRSETWLGRDGWRRHGLIDLSEKPRDHAVKRGASPLPAGGSKRRAASAGAVRARALDQKKPGAGSDRSDQLSRASPLGRGQPLQRCASRSLQ